MQKTEEPAKPTHLNAQKRVISCLRAAPGLTIAEANKRLIKYKLMQEGSAPPTTWSEVSAKIPESWTISGEGNGQWGWVASVMNSVTSPRIPEAAVA